VSGGDRDHFQWGAKIWPALGFGFWAFGRHEPCWGRCELIVVCSSGDGDDCAWADAGGAERDWASGDSSARCGGSGGASANVGSAALNGVAATSACNASAVGGYYDSQGNPTGALVEHWNGKAWKVQKSPRTNSNFTVLEGVTAVSPRDAWAVGYRNCNYTYSCLYPGRALDRQDLETLSRSPGPTSLCGLDGRAAFVVGLQRRPRDREPPLAIVRDAVLGAR